MTRIVPFVVALIPALWLSSAAALGLGDIDVRSRLNQRFVATIPLTDLQPGDAESLKVALASAAEFEKAGIDRGDYLASLRFNLITQGNPRIEVSSAQPAREPYLNFLVEVRGGGNRLLREYTVLLDPPNMPEVASPRPAPTRSTAAEPSAPTRFYETAEESSRRPAAAPAPAQPAPAAGGAGVTIEPPSPTPASATVGSDRYGPVQPGETFWSIATRLRPDAGVTMDQMLLGLYRGNPKAFDGGINGLRKGATLNVPSRDQFTAVSAAEAKAEVAQLRGQRAARKPDPRPAPAAPAVAVTEPVVVPTPEPAPAPEPPAQKKTSEPKQPVAPKPAPATAEPPKPQASVTPPPAPAPAVAAVTPAPAPSTTASPAEPPAATTDPATTPPGADAPAEPATPPAEAQVPAVEEPAPTPAPAVEPAPAPVVAEEPSLLETLLLPLVGGLALLGLVGFLVAKVLRRKPSGLSVKAVKSAAESPPPAAVPSARPDIAAAGVKGGKAALAGGKLTAQQELERLQESLDETIEVGGATQQMETQRLQTQQFATQKLSTQQLETQQLSVGERTAATPAPDATGLFEAPPPAAPEEHVDFDLTGQFESQTVSIDLDANDPVSEADFHLAYGLYDEAALLLKQAAAKEPQRSDIRLKLAETYFAAGKVAEFQSTAEALKAQLAPGDWQKLAIMGQQLCPDAEIFKDAGGTSAVSADLDLAFDEPAAELPPPAAPAPAASASLPAAAPMDDGLEFRIEDLELPALETQALAVAPDKGESLEFDLGDFDLDAKPAAAAAPAAAPAPAGNEMEFDLGDFDLPAAKPSAAPAAAGKPPSDSMLAGSSSVVSEIRLEDFDLGDLPIDSGEISGDEAGTKLDLARAYIDMGDNDMARSLLSEVLQQGNAAQQQEAKALIGRLA